MTQPCITLNVIVGQTGRMQTYEEKHMKQNGVLEWLLGFYHRARVRAQWPRAVARRGRLL